MESTFGVSSQLWMLSSSDFVRFAIQLEWKVIRGSCPPCQYLAADTMSTWKEGSSLRLHSWKLDLQEQNARSNHGLNCRKGSSCRPSPPAAPCAPPPASSAHLLRYSHLPLVSSIHIPSGILPPPLWAFTSEQLWAMWNYSLSELFKCSLVELSSCELCGTAVSLFSSSFVPLPLPLSGPICFPCAEKLGFNSWWTFSRQT